jgi:glucokinase
MLLAGDIGGTKSALAIFSSERGPRVPLAQAEYQSGDFPDLATIVHTFLATTALPVDRACFDVAGPVLGGRAHVTNLSWVLDGATLAQELGIPTVRLLNDLEALARAVPLLGPDDLLTLNAGEVDPGGAIAVIAPGTGLGEAFLTWDGNKYHAHPSEGGHTDFAPADELQIGLLEYMLRQYDHVSYEHVCSGIGIPNLYAYLRDRGCEPESPAVATRLAVASEPTKLICEAALDATSPDALCAATLDLFLAILGAEAGNLALKVLARGGIYLGGGIPIHIAPAVSRGVFMTAFRAKGRFTQLLGRVPVHLIVRQAALIGTADYGLSLPGSP